MSCVLVAVLFISCDRDVADPDEFQEHPIVFQSAVLEEQFVSRAPALLAHGFTVWGYKTTPVDDVQRVFQGYAVKYVAGSGGSSVDNTDNYSYVDGLDQDIKYWDLAASEYNFWGYTGDKGDFGSDGTALTISGLAQSVEEPSISDKMFSALYHRSPVTPVVVQLQFKRPYAQVRVMFYCGETLEAGDQVEIGASTFGPESGNVISQGTLTITYPKTGSGQETFATSNTTNGAALAFDAVLLTPSVGTSSNNAALAVPDGGNEFYYVVPYTYAAPFVLTTTVDDDPKTASVPAELMHWLPNYTYTYIFKITEAGKKIEFYDVKIDPWKYGGSQDNTWKNW